MYKLPLFGAALLAAGAVQADTTLDYEVRGDGAAGSQTIQISGAKLRLVVSEGGQDNVMLYDAASNTLTILDPQTRSYMEMDSAIAAEMRQTMQDIETQIRAQMQAQMAQMSEEERQALEQMMGELLGQTDNTALQWRVEDTGRSAEVNGFPCQLFEMSRNGGQVQELCLADQGTLKLGDAEYRTARALFDLLDSMAGAQSPDLAKLEGLPVRSVEDGEDGQRVTELRRVDSVALDPALFRVPEGYTAEAPFSQP